MQNHLQVFQMFCILTHCLQKLKIIQFQFHKKLDIAATMFTRKPEEHGCAPEFKDLMDIIMEEDLQMPSNASEAKNLYTTLLHHIVELNNQ